MVGGGCMGTSIAFHLARRGVRTVLIERDHVASGATGHSGALVRQHYESRVGIRLARASLAFFQRFEKETGFPSDFRTTGFLSGTNEKDRPAFDALFELLRSEGVSVKRLSPKEATEMEPQMNATDYVSVVYDPVAGYADPIATAAGLAMGAAASDAVVVEGQAATSVTTRAGRVTGVKLRGPGTIASERVVLAAGNWTPELAQPLGIRLPIRYVRGDVVLLRRPVGFGASPKIHFDFYANTYSRPEGDKDTLVGYMDTNSRKTIRSHEMPSGVVSAPKIRDLRKRLSWRFPRMAWAQPRGGWSGAYDVTPDAYPILDRVGPRGLFAAVGFSGHGFKLCPEVGRLMAEYVTTGRRPEGLVPLRATRFSENDPVRAEAPFPPRRAHRLP